MLSVQEKQLMQMRNLADTPDSMLKRDSAADDMIFEALKKSQAATAIPPGNEAEQIPPNTEIPPTPENNTQSGTPNADPFTPPQQAHGIPPMGNPALQYADAVKPSKLINFKLKDLFEPELIIMIIDMLLSWGGSLLLRSNGIMIESEQLQADGYQKELLLKAFAPAFNTYEVGTNNPGIGIALAMTAVYGKNIIEAIRIYKAEEQSKETGTAFIKPKHKRASYTKRESKLRTKKQPSNIQFTPQYL